MQLALAHERGGGRPGAPQAAAGGGRTGRRCRLRHRRRRRRGRHAASGHPRRSGRRCAASRRWTGSRTLPQRAGRASVQLALAAPGSARTPKQLPAMRAGERGARTVVYVGELLRSVRLLLLRALHLVLRASEGFCRRPARSAPARGAPSAARRRALGIPGGERTGWYCSASLR